MQFVMDSQTVRRDINNMSTDPGEGRHNNTVNEVANLANDLI